MSEFIKGKWYRSNNGPGNTFFIKVRTIGRDQQNCIELFGESIGSWRDINAKYNRVDGVSNENMLKIMLEIGPMDDLSELTNDLPANHPDKIVPDIKVLINQFLEL